MSKLSRRHVLSSAMAGTALATIPLPEWLARRAQAQTPKVRYDANSPEGHDNLKIYADAVGKMMDTSQYPLGNPRNWNFQWNTHWTPGLDTNDKTKNAEIAAIYGSGSSPNKQLAEDMWNTCQAHAQTNNNEENFVPWHRMYVLYLEEIVRGVTGASEFTLPYWSYDDPNNRMIPAQFRQPGDPVFGPLYRQNRNPGVNNGTPIDQISGAATMNNNSLLQTDYLPSSQVKQGFNQTLDFGMHGAVHVNVGTSTNMGFVPTAAGDPVFWMHHCQIDRYWASWNINGGSNPPDSWNNWGKRSWTFVDGNGQGVSASIAQVTKGTVRLGYTFATTIPVPTRRPALVAAAPSTVLALSTPADTASHGVTATGHGSGIRLGDRPVTVELASAVSVSGFHGALAKLTAEGSAATAATAERKALYLTVDRLTTSLQPGVGYDVYLELPKDASPRVAAGHKVGGINFFHAHRAGAVHGDHALSYVFDVTDVAANLALKGRLTRSPSVTVAPTGTPLADAQASIGSFQLLEA